VSLSRREFLGHSLKIGAGAVALGAGGIGGGLLLGGEASGATPLSPAVPSNVQSFVTQPDFHPVGVSIARSSSLPAGTPEYLFLAPRASTLGPLPTGADPGLMICDLDGNLVWWSRRASAGYDPFNFRVQTYQGRPVLTWFQGTIGPGYATGGSYQIANGDYVQIESFKAHNTPSDLHEFIINAEDHALVTSYDPATYSPLVVGHAQIIDIASGDLLFDWPSYPAVPESESYTNPTGGGDYFHINSIDQYPDSTGDLLISARNTSTVYRVSRSTGKIVWRLGGMNSNFSMGPGRPFASSTTPVSSRARPGSACTTTPTRAPRSSRGARCSTSTRRPGRRRCATSSTTPAPTPTRARRTAPTRATTSFCPTVATSCSGATSTTSPSSRRQAGA
jgi:hypothetical protein